MPETRARHVADQIDLDQRVLHEHVQTCLESDVRALRQVGNLGQFQVFLRVLAARSAQLLNLADLGRDLGLALNTDSAGDRPRPRPGLRDREPRLPRARRRRTAPRSGGASAADSDAVSGRRIKARPMVQKASAAQRYPSDSGV